MSATHSSSNPAGNATALLLVAALVSSARAAERPLTSFDSADQLSWMTVNDGVMGGLSAGTWEVTDDGTLRFAGEISLENNGGFSSIRTRPAQMNLGDRDGLALRLRGDGRTYRVSLRTSSSGGRIAYWAEVPTRAGQWQVVEIPFEEWVPTSFGRKLSGPVLDRAAINSIGFMMYDKAAGPFLLEVDWIHAYTGRFDPPATVPSAAIEPGESLLATAKSAGTFTTLLAAVDAAGMTEVLMGSGPFTLLAPTDEAFAALPGEVTDQLLQPENRSALRTILGFHVVAGSVTAAELMKAPWVTTLTGQRVGIRGENGGIVIDRSTVIEVDIECDNGIVHVIDRVLMPELQDVSELASASKIFSTLLAAADAAGLLPALAGDDPITIFAPTDDAFAALPEGLVANLLRPESHDELVRVLLNHVVLGTIYSDSALSEGSVQTVVGTDLAVAYAQGRVTVAGANVLVADVEAKNGIIHVIDSVMLPPAPPQSTRSVSLASPVTPALPGETAAVITRAIDKGVTLFNDGDSAGCAEVYQRALELLLERHRGSFHRALRRDLAAALDSAVSDSVARAWELRSALDAAWLHLGL